jgi:hypothetical protein
MTIIQKLDKLEAMKQGTRILYSPQFGDGFPEEATFHRLRNKGGEYIIDVEINNGSLRWGYINQITII